MNNSRARSRPTQNVDIRIIGPRRSGKTTYLSTLAYFPHSKQLNADFPGLEVLVGDDATAELATMAENIIKRGNNLAGTRRGEGIDDLSEYSLRIKLPPLSQDIELCAKDMAGEIFEDFALARKRFETQPYIDDLFSATGWMLMLTDWEPGRDVHLYKPIFENLCHEIQMREEMEPEIKKLRLAVVMTKCERGELWPGRLDPEEDLFKVRLPETHKVLREQLAPHRVSFFACSSFGVLSDRKEDFDPRPNRYVPDDGSSAEDNSFLRNPNRWHPYGLFSPIYWLAGQRSANPKL